MLLSCFVLAVWSTQYVWAECPTIIERKEWDGEKAEYVKYLNVPVDLVVIQHTVTQSCSYDQSCAEIVRNIQKTHKEKAFLWDIGPSFLIAGTGKIYEGRGWNRVAFHTAGFNNQSIGIAFIGSYNNQEPTLKSLNSARDLIKCGVDENRLTDDHQVVVHSQLVPTDSPGKKLTSKVMSWPDWKQDVTEILKRADNPEELNEDKELDDSIKNKYVSETEEATTDSIRTRSKKEILTKPKEIDLLSNLRDVIAELIDNLRNLAQQVLKTIDSLSRGLNKEMSFFVDKLTTGLRGHKDQLTAAADVLSKLPDLDKCANPIKNKGSNLYDNTEAKARACAQERVKEVDDMIKSLDALAHNATLNSKIAVQDTRNCTELNYGIESVTRACLNSVTSQVQSAINVFEAQRTIAVNFIETSLKALPAALDLCATKNLLASKSQTTTIISDISKCKPSIPLIRPLFPFGG